MKEAIAAPVVSGLVDSDRLKAIATLVDVDAAGWIPAPAAATCPLILLVPQFSLSLSRVSLSSGFSSDFQSRGRSQAETSQT